MAWHSNCICQGAEEETLIRWPYLVRLHLANLLTMVYSNLNHNKLSL